MNKLSFITTLLATPVLLVAQSEGLRSGRIFSSRCRTSGRATPGDMTGKRYQRAQTKSIRRP